MSEHYAGNIDLSEQLKDSRKRLRWKKTIQRNTLILLLVCVFIYALLHNIISIDPTGYLPSEKDGRINAVKSFNAPLMSYEDRLEHATYIVKSLNSLSYRDKDEVLSSIERYFSPNVFKGYIVNQYNNGFFRQMNKYSVSYIAKLEPGYLHKGEPVPVIYAEDICYTPEVMGDSTKAGVDCRHSAPVNRFSETFFFNLRRFVVVNSVTTKVQEFKVQIVLTRVDDALYDKGFLVSEYTEI